MKTFAPAVLGTAVILSAFALPAHANTGVASYYGAELAGRKTANGERFNPNGLTAAHRSLPFGTVLRLTNLSNGRVVVVRINDRGPFVHGRVLDVSHGAARVLGMTGSGTARLSIETIKGGAAATPKAPAGKPAAPEAPQSAPAPADADLSAQHRDEVMGKV